MEEKTITLTQRDYEELLIWITNLEARIRDLEDSVGIMEDMPRHSTLAKKRIYEEVSHKEIEV